MDEKEQDLIARCQGGDSEAFGEIYDLYSVKIYNYLFYRLSQKEASEDLTSQIFIKALEKIGTFNQRKGNFSAWIYRIARNTLFDYYRTRHKAMDLEAAGEISSNENLEKGVEAREGLRKVMDYLETIPKEHKEIILLRVWDGLSYGEISEIIGKSEAACQMTFSRAIAKLQKEIPIGLALLLVTIQSFK